MGKDRLLCWLNPPGDVEEREANAVLDEDGEVVHIQHRVAGKDNRRRRFWGQAEASRMCCVCVDVLHLLIFLLSRAPSLDLAGALGVVDVLIR